ncbi:conserved hypothetical protein [Arthrobacter sp. Hiyo4]|nr:conserved hypothetical protein [Arthrobacter sp. Hiyo4]
MHKDAARRAPRKQMLAGLVSAVAIVAAAGAGLAASSVAPQPVGSRSIPAVLAAVPAGASTGVCPGPARLLKGTEAGTDPQFSPESATAKSAVTGAVLSAPGYPPRQQARRPRRDARRRNRQGRQPARPGDRSQDLTAGVLAGHSVDDASFLSADAQAGQKPSAAGLMRFTATDGDLQGSAAANCQPPANDLWLSGASTTVGRTSVLVLSNASSTPATVSLELFGSKGQIQAPGSRGCWSRREVRAQSSWLAWPLVKPSSRSMSGAPAVRWPRPSSRVSCGDWRRRRRLHCSGRRTCRAPGHDRSGHPRRRRDLRLYGE